MTTERDIGAGEVVLPAADLAATLDFFTDTLGFRLLAIFPAEDPEIAVIDGYGLRLRLDRGFDGAPGRLRLTGEEGTLHAPNGTAIDIAPTDGMADVPPPADTLSIVEAGDWVTGRAGMLYRDLVPDRAGGHVVASHIRIPRAGPVADMVHYHRVRFQIIHCLAGWVRLVYEDQGPPFVMEAGDCVLQPPEIRHRVLEASAGLEVVEVASPAAHPTLIDHDLDLPTATLAPERDFAGQRFHLHRAGEAAWAPSELAGFEIRDIGLSAPTGGIAEAHLLRASAGGAGGLSTSHPGVLLLFIVRGELDVDLAGEPARRIGGGAAITLPPATPCRIAARSDDLEILRVHLKG